MGIGDVVLAEGVSPGLFCVQLDAGQTFGESLPAILNEGPVDHVNSTSMVGVVSGSTVLPEELHVGAQEVVRPLKYPYSSSGTTFRHGGTSGGI